MHLIMRLVSRAFFPIVAALSLSTASWAEPLDARETVEKATAEVLTVLKEYERIVDEDPDRYYEEVDKVFGPYVDYFGIARSIMAIHYRTASKDQKIRFVENFKWGLIRTYSKFLLLVDSETVKVSADQAPTRGGRYHNVDIDALSKSGRSFTLSFSMVRNKKDRWRARNLIVGGINLGLTYRGQFEEEITQGVNHGNLDAVIDNWVEKSIKAELKEKAKAQRGNTKAAAK